MCVCALVLAVGIPFIMMLFGNTAEWSEWLYRGLTFLVVSCPCALVISIPLSFFSGIGGASRAGVLIKGSNYMETLAKTDVMVFDKTGTLTKGNFKVNSVFAVDGNSEKLLEYALIAESASSHPISLSLMDSYGKVPDLSRTYDVTEIAGKGIRATVDGIKVSVGNTKLMDEVGAEYAAVEDIGTTVHVALDGNYAGYIVIRDELKKTSADALSALKKTGIRKTVMLTGDNKKTAQYIAKEAGIDTVYSELLPQDKVTKLEELLKEQKQGRCLAFVGDGINDAPVISRADVGIAMGGMGSQAAIEAADIVLMDDDLQKVGDAIRISRKCVRIVYENTVFAIGIKILCLILTAAGFSNMWLAIFADVGVMVLAVINAMRALYVKNVL